MDLIFDLPGVKKIVRTVQCGDGQLDTGVSDDDVPLDFLMNFRVGQLPVYLTAIQVSGLDPADFGVADQAWGSNDDTGHRWTMDPDVHKGFYWNCSIDDLQKFHQAFDAVLKAHPTFAHC